MQNDPTDEDRKRAREWIRRMPDVTTSAGVFAWTLYCPNVAQLIADTRRETAEAIYAEILSVPIYEGDVRAACAAIARRHGGAK